MRKIMLLDRPRPDLILGEILEQVDKLKDDTQLALGVLDSARSNGKSGAD